MAFRISDSTLFADAVRNMRNNRFALSEIQNQLTSGKRVNSASDDPSDASRILRLRRGQGQLDQFERNIGQARTRLDLTESALVSTTDLLSRLRELAVQADSPDEPNFDKIAVEVEELYNEIFRVANTSNGTERIFAGFQSRDAAFTLVGGFTPNVADPAAPDAVYNGDHGEIRVQIGELSTIGTNIPGSQVFLGDYDGDGATDAGAVNIFEVVRDLRNRLVDPIGYPGGGVPPGPQETLDALDTAIDQIVSARARVGANDSRLDLASKQIQDLSVSFAIEKSALEDVDFVEAATELASREVILQSSLSVSARILQPTLLNFLR